MNNKDLRVVALVSADPSDIYFANQLLKNLNVVAVFVEQQREPTTTHSRISAILRYCRRPFPFLHQVYQVGIRKYYAKKAKRIAMLGFGGDGYGLDKTNACQVVYTRGIGAINTRPYADLIRGLAPDVIALCGASIIREPILSITPYIVNLHSGLSQWYRGVWTTLWAIHNEEPEYVGYTIHFVAKGIDDGDVICQGRPQICRDDNHESLYVKTIKKGTEATLATIRNIQESSFKRYPLKQKGKVYLNSMLAPSIIRKTWQKVKAGIIREYVKHPKHVDLIGGEK